MRYQHTGDGTANILGWRVSAICLVLLIGSAIPALADDDQPNRIRVE